MDNIARWLTYLAVAGWVVTAFLMTRLPPMGDIQQSLYRQPVQTARPSYGAFNFRYNGQNITVVPQADYYLWGLVVSHNDPTTWWRFDISHDDKSPNVRDICVLWGSNLQHTTYEDVSFHNEDNFCLWRWKPGVALNEDEISNNHLVTGNDAIRERIRNIHIGDQVYIKGMLVNYSEARWNGRFRNTSMTRTDRGDGACEIIYVQDVQVLSSYNGPWAALHELCFMGFIAMVLLRIIMFFMRPAEI